MQSATILSACQVDTYEFEAPVTGRMTIQLGDISGSNLVATLSALDSTGSVTISDDGATDIGISRFVTFDVIVGETYGLKVAATTGGAAAEAVGDYTLTFTTDFANTFATPCRSRSRPMGSAPATVPSALPGRSTPSGSNHRSAVTSPSTWWRPRGRTSIASSTSSAPIRD